MTKKLLSLVLTIVLLLVTATSANAVEPVGELVSSDVFLSPSEHATYSVLGQNAPSALVEMLEAQNITITRSSLIEVIPSISSQTGDALVVTNIIGNSIEKNFTIAIGENNNVLDITVPDDSMASPTDSSVIEYPFPEWDDRLTITATARYNRYSDPDYGLSMYFQPLSASMRYSKGTTCTVARIQTIYICQGPAYSYPGFVMQGSSNVTHSIPITISSPIENLTYSNYNQPYSSSRVIYTGLNNAGLYTTGQYMTFNYTVDGDVCEYTYRF